MCGHELPPGPCNRRSASLLNHRLIYGRSFPTNYRYFSSVALNEIHVCRKMDYRPRLQGDACMLDSSTFHPVRWLKGAYKEVGYPFDSGDHNILWLAIGGPRKGLPIAPRFQACDGHGACVILDRPETQPRGPIACRPASGAPGCILGAVCWRPWIDQTTTPRAT